MNLEQYLLVKIAEECAEVAQMAMKTAQFGLTETKTGENKNNAQRLKAEIIDLIAVINMLNDQTGELNLPIYVQQDDKKDIYAKMERVEKYLELSVKLGKVVK